MLSDSPLHISGGRYLVFTFVFLCLEVCRLPPNVLVQSSAFLYIELFILLSIGQLSPYLQFIRLVLETHLRGVHKPGVSRPDSVNNLLETAKAVKVKTVVCTYIHTYCISTIKFMVKGQVACFTNAEVDKGHEKPYFYEQ